MKKLYETNSYLKKWDCVVLSCEEIDNRYFVEFDESAFFPEEGGQYADTGTIEHEGLAVKLLDGQIKEGRILYEVEEHLAPGTRVSCELNFEERFSRMQQHSGEHIVVGLIHNIYGYDNVGFHLSDEKPVTLDINGELTADQIYEIERKANEIIYKNYPIKASLPSAEELQAIAYRSKIEIDGQVRLITIGDEQDTIDICACCAPHVAFTGEIGIIKVVAFEKYKGGMRISILCGQRALEYFNSNLNIVSKLERTMSTSKDNLVDQIANLKNDNSNLQYEVNCLKEQILINSIPVVNSDENICMFTTENLSSVVMKNIFNALTERTEGFACLCVGNDEAGYRFNAGSRIKDSRILSKMFMSKFSAKCGGSDRMISGKLLVNEKDIRAFFDEMEEVISE